MNPTTQQILAVVLPLMAAAATAFRKWTQQHFTPAQLAHVTDVARVAVRAAEEVGQSFKGEDPAAWGKVYGWGVAKRDYAASVIVDGAKRLGVKLTPAEVDAFLHVSLREMEQLASDAAAPTV